MGFLTPDITKPVKLQLSAADAQREALGRTLSMGGAVTGVIGGVMILSANPAVRAAVQRKSGVDMTLSVAQARQDALGKALAILGLSVGLTGSILTMSANPKMKAHLGGVYSRLPAAVRDNKAVLGGVLAAAAIGLAWFMISAQKKAYGQG